MNNLKFRVWDKENSKWYKAIYKAYKDCVEFMVVTMDGDLLMIKNGEIIHQSIFPNRFELVQSTGLFDKNGIEIFNGDIVKNFLDEPAIVKFGEYMAGGTDFYAESAYGFYVQRLLKGQEIEDDTETLGNHEVIGNRFTNPELLNNQN